MLFRSELMCRFAVDFTDLGVDAPEVFVNEWPHLQAMEDDGLLKLSRNGVEVTDWGRWLIRVVAAVFDPDTAAEGSGSTP